MPEKIIRMPYPPTGELKFGETYLIGISPCTPSELGELTLGEIQRAADSHDQTWTHFWRREDTYSWID